ncbi:MAG: arylesterase [Gammaproteobacteria bacterium]|nr:arylesterase [Gammaproteobacteria bacterium]
MRQYIPRALVFLAVLFVAGLPGRTLAYSVLVMGDSLSASYGIPIDSGWVSLLSKRVANRNISVHNLSIPGETSYGGSQRISQALIDYNPDIVVLELGANDGLQGLDVNQMRHNLFQIIQSSRSHGSKVLLLGMMIPPNYGKVYTQAFQNVYLELASELSIPVVPFLLESVALDYALMQEDGYHPTELAQPIILETVWAELSRLLPK